MSIANNSSDSTNLEHPHECLQCGTVYDADQKPPAGATIYWEPHCPECNAKISAIERTPETIRVAIDVLSHIEDAADREEWLNNIQLWARYLHGYK